MRKKSLLIASITVPCVKTESSNGFANLLSECASPDVRFSSSRRIPTSGASFTTSSKTTPISPPGARPIRRGSNKSPSSNASRRKNPHLKPGAIDVAGPAPPLEFSAKSRGFLRLARLHFRTPAKFFEQRIRFAFDGVGDDFTEHRRELKSMAAVAGRDGQSGTLRLGSDPKISIMGIAIETDAREYNWGIRQRRKGVGQKMA